jgi:hypothetical protein
MKHFLNINWAGFLLMSYLGLSYYYFGGWWNSSLGTALILFFGYLLWKKDFLRVCGLKVSARDLLRTAGLAILIIAASFLLVRYIGQKNEVALQFTGFRNYYHDVFYILNEEIVLGGITIFILINRLKIKPLLATVCLAGFFSLIHFVFYKWIFLESGQLTISTLVTLFMVAIVRNNLIIIYRHIGYSWALHFGWMVIMFGSRLYYVESGDALTEPERFNLLLGSHEMLILSCILAAMSLLHLIKKYQKKS